MKILFVCTGNTCRSIMAEAIFKSFNDNNCLEAYSAGTSAFPHSKASLNAVNVVMDNLNYDIENREAIQINEKIVMECDLVLTMTESIKNSMTLNFPKFSEKIFSLGSYLGKKDDIIDPYGSNLKNYEKTFFQLKDKLIMLIGKIKEDKGI
ncbi:low molecular weight protein arginine phosphatase [Haloimpatiens sp. FM7315]|uniref:low molecular weight protein arginine phosphatase n=1 Tax=Haloimpatiens sp. FM7315 TaxID=3298609 RepID=UPI0035A3BEB3